MQEGNSRDAIFGFGNVLWMLLLAAAVAAPLGWGLIQIGLIPGLNAFTRGPIGREIGAIIGRDLLGPAYFTGLLVLGFVMQICRPLVPLLLIGAVVWWSWVGLATAYDAGLIVMHFGAPGLR